MDATAKIKPKTRDGFRIAIFCALRIESNAVEALFDHVWEGAESFGKAPGDNNAYTTGRIGRHNVVLAFLPGMGTTDASASAASFRMSYRGIELGLVVGICGVVPTTGDDGHEIVLGDVIISTGVVQGDFGRRLPHKFERKDTLHDILARPSPEIRAFLHQQSGNRSRNRLRDHTQEHLSTLCTRKEFQSSSDPGPGADILYEPSYRHKHQSPGFCADCDACKTEEDEPCQSALKAFCRDVGCTATRQISRDRLSDFLESRSPEGSSLDRKPYVHFGDIISSNTLMRSATHRDIAAKEVGAIAFEMESAGVWDKFPTIVVKSACDYADSHKNKRWQDYAALVAACCSKAILEEWTTEDRTPVPNQLHNSRDSELEHLKSLLFDEESVRKVAIYGLGGIGKTQIALNLAYQALQKLPPHSVFWMVASSLETYEQSCLNLAQLLGVLDSIEPETDVKQIIKECLSQVTSQKWLMILDAADNDDLWFTSVGPESAATPLIDYLPRNVNGTFLFTTRDRKAAVKMAGTKSIEISKLEIAVSFQLLEKSLRLSKILDDTKSVNELVTKLTGLPLALSQAAAYINANDTSIAEYLSLIDETEESFIAMLSEDFEDDGRQRPSKNPVASTWWISFEKLKSTNPLAAELLSFMSCLGPYRIPDSLLPPPKSLKEKTDAIGSLTAYSFVSRDIRDSYNGESLWSLHRLVSLSTKSWLKRNHDLERYTSQAVEIVSEMVPVREAGSQLWSLFLPHADFVLQASPLGMETDRKCFLMAKIGARLMFEGKYKTGADRLHLFIEDAKKSLGEKDPHVIQCMGFYSETLRLQGKWDLAQDLQTKILEIQTQNLGQHHPTTLSIKEALALTYEEQSQLHCAAKLLEEVKEAYEKTHGETHADTLATSTRLGKVYSGLSRWKDAERLQRLVADAAEKTPAVLMDTKVSNMCNLASTYASQGRWEEAEKWHQNALIESKRALGEAHPKTLTIVGSLARAYYNHGRYEAARELELGVVETARQEFGDSHPNTLRAQHNLAMTYKEQGRYGEAEKLETDTLRLSQESVGDDHPITLQAQDGLALIYASQEKLQEAEDLLFQAVEKYKRICGENHSKTLESMGNLVTIYAQREMFHKATEMESEVNRAMTRNLGHEHSSTLVSKQNLGLLYHSLGRYEEAEKLLSDVRHVRKLRLGEEHPDTLAVTDGLSSALASLGRLAEAVKLQISVAELTEKRRGKNHPATLSAQHNLALLYSRQERWEEFENVESSVLDRCRKILGESHPQTLRSISALRICYQKQERWDEALALYKHFIQEDQERPEMHGIDGVPILQQITLIYYGRKQWSEVAAVQRKVLDIQTRVLGENDSATLSTMTALANFLVQQEFWNDAMELEKKLLVIRKRLGNDTSSILDAMTNLSLTYCKVGQYDEAVQLLGEWLQLQVDTAGEDNAKLLEYYDRLAYVFSLEGDIESLEFCNMQRALLRLIV